MSSETRLTLTYDLSNCTTPTQYDYADYNFVVTFTANEGCQFVIGDTENYLEYADSSKWIPSNDRYGVVDNVVKTVRMITQMKDYPTSAVMHIKAYQIQPVSIPLTQNLTNCTSNISDTAVLPSTVLTITLTANTGYEFNSGNIPTYNVNGTVSNFTRISNSVYSAELTTPTTGSITVSATAVQMIPLTQNLTNCTSNISETTVLPSTEITIILTANTSYEFETLPSYSINGVTSNFHRNSAISCYADIETPATGSVVVNAAAVEGGYSVTYHLSHCSVTPVISRIDYSHNITFTVTADSGYKFDTTNPPSYSAGTDDRYRLTKVDDYTYTLESDNVISKRALNIYGSALQEISPPTPSTEISYGFINIYLPSMETLKNLSKRRFYNSNDELQDMFKFVYKVHKMYFNIPATTETTIALAYYRTGITCLATDNAFVNVNCGSVVVSELYGNVFDYQYTMSTIYLPFIGYQNLDTASIMNSTLKLEYRANIVTGKTIAVVSTIERGELYQFEGYGGFDIPYMFNDFTGGVNHELYQSSAYLGSFVPSLTLTTNVPYGNDRNNIFGYGVYQWCRIGDCTGYIKCSDIQLIITQNYMTNSEMNMITELLQAGVFVN